MTISSCAGGSRGDSLSGGLLPGQAGVDELEAEVLLCERNYDCEDDAIAVSRVGQPGISLGGLFAKLRSLTAKAALNQLVLKAEKRMSFAQERATPKMFLSFRAEEQELVLLKGRSHERPFFDRNIYNNQH